MSPDDLTSDLLGDDLEAFLDPKGELLGDSRHSILGSVGVYRFNFKRQEYDRLGLFTTDTAEFWEALQPHEFDQVLTTFGDRYSIQIYRQRSSVPSKGARGPVVPMKRFDEMLGRLVGRDDLGGVAKATMFGVVAKKDEVDAARS